MMNHLPPGYRITTRPMLTAVSDVVWQLKDPVGQIVAERLSPISDIEALDMIKNKGAFVSVTTARGQRYPGRDE